MYRMFDDVQVYCDLGEIFRVYRLYKTKKIRIRSYFGHSFRGYGIIGRMFHDVQLYSDLGEKFRVYRLYKTKKIKIRSYFGPGYFPRAGRLCRTWYLTNAYHGSSVCSAAVRAEGEADRRYIPAGFLRHGRKYGVEGMEDYVYAGGVAVCVLARRFALRGHSAQRCWVCKAVGGSVCHAS